MEWGMKSMSGMAKSQRWGWLKVGQNALCNHLRGNQEPSAQHRGKPPTQPGCASAICLQVSWEREGRKRHDSTLLRIAGTITKCKC